ncbi:MAG: TSUP family transporter [Thermoleophilaceae bacterium]
MVLAAVATFVGASVQSATGFGFALVLSPAMFAVFDRYEAITALLALGLAINLLVLADSGARSMDWRGLAPALYAALPGLGLGALALALVSKPGLQLVVGAAVLAAGAWQLGGARPLAIPAWAAGFMSGVLTTSISVSGPPLVLWLEARGVRPGELRAALAACFLALNLAGGALLLVAGGTGRAISPGTLGWLLVVLAAGHFAGARAFRRLPADRFRVVVLALVCAAGAASLAAGILGL